MNFKAVLTSLNIFLVAFCAQAMTSTDVLPSGVSSPSFRYGVIDGIDEKYTESGSLMKLGDYKSVVFDAAHLANFNADAKRLIDALNRFGARNLGDNFNLGVLRVDTAPKVHYFAPVFARGITSKWTVGIGMPIVTYENKISVSQQFSNIDYYRKQFSGLSAELDDALRTNLADATQKALIEKGYKPLQNHNDTFVGDVQLVSMYKFYEDLDQAFLYQAQLNLPTGPKYNADDLAAINIFGRTNLNSTLAYSRKVGSRVTLVPYLSYLFNIQDKVTERVPTDENDTLPDQASREEVNRQPGNTVAVGGNMFVEVTDSFSLGGGYENSQKQADSFSGSRNARYDLLSKNTNMKAQRVRGLISYSSVKSFFRKTALLPMIVTLEVSDVVAGENVERQLVQEMNLTMFF